MNIIVEVTQKNIKDGISKSHQQCPIALALNSKIKCDDVGALSLLMRDKTRIPLPDVAVNFIRLYDKGIEVEPFNFSIDIDEQYLIK